MSAATANCLICFETKNKWPGECEHEFCEDCMRRHVELAVTSADFTRDGLIRHPCGQCTGGLSEKAIEGLVGTDMLNKYKRFVYDRKVTEDPSLYWCPRPGCVNVVKREGTQRRLRCDKCTIRFCAMCGSAHLPMIACELADVRFQAWRLFAGSPGEGIKRCPKCRYFIEKNEGCHHMTCRQCHHQFCWICRSDWNNHGNRQILCELQAIHAELRHIHARMWEKVVRRPDVRVPVRMLSELIVTPVGIGVVCAGVGLGIAGGVTFVVVAPPVYGAKHCISYLKERARRRRRRVEARRQRNVHTTQQVVDINVGRLILQHGVTIFLGFHSNDAQWAAIRRMFELSDISDGSYCTVTQVNGFDALLRFIPTDFTGDLSWYNGASPTVDLMSGHRNVSQGIHTVRIEGTVGENSLSKKQLLSAVWGVATTYSVFPFDEEIDLIALESLRTRYNIVQLVESDDEWGAESKAHSTHSSQQHRQTSRMVRISSIPRFEKRINFNEAYATENVEDGILQIGKYIQAMSIQAETQTLAGASPTASTETVVECGPIQSLDEPPALNREASLLENKVVSEVDTSSTLSVATMFTNSTECAHDAAFLEDGESVQSAATLKGEGMLVEDTTSRHLLEVNLDAIDVGELN